MPRRYGPTLTPVASALPAPGSHSAHTLLLILMMLLHAAHTFELYLHLLLISTTTLSPRKAPASEAALLTMLADDDAEYADYDWRAGGCSPTSPFLCLLSFFIFDQRRVRTRDHPVVRVRPDLQTSLPLHKKLTSGVVSKRCYLFLMVPFL